MFDYLVTKDNLEDLSENIKGNDNINIIFSDISIFSDDDFEKYRAELTKVVEYIYNSYVNFGKVIAVNVITDIFSINARDIDDNFLFCKICPCLHCKPNEKLFKEKTGDNFIPFKAYCKKAFIEYKESQELLFKLKLLDEYKTLNYDEYFELIDSLYGSSLWRNSNE
jgi:hypothetical protein